MNNKKDFSPTVYKFKDAVMEQVENTDLFKSYIKTTEFKQLFNDTLWAEGPCYIPHKDMLVWSNLPNKNIPCLNLSANSYHTVFIQILSGFLTYIWNIGS